MTEAPKISVRGHGEAAVIDIAGQVTALTGQPIEEAYQKVTAAGAAKILLVFSADAYINSGGIAILIGILSQSKKNGQAIRMTGLSAHFQKIFAMVGLTKYAQIHASEDAALADF
jgi:anti-anti-sigma factor